MNYLSIKNFRTEENQMVDMKLSMVDVKILHNACVDILNECPDMIGYDNVRQILEKIILDNQK